MSIQRHLEFNPRANSAVSYSFFNPFIFLLVLPSHPLHSFSNPTFCLSFMFPFYLPLPFQTPSTFSTLAFSFFYCFSLEFVILFQVYYGVTSSAIFRTPITVRLDCVRCGGVLD